MALKVLVRGHGQNYRPVDAGPLESTRQLQKGAPLQGEKVMIRFRATRDGRYLLVIGHYKHHLAFHEVLDLTARIRAVIGTQVYGDKLAKEEARLRRKFETWLVRETKDRTVKRVERFLANKKAKAKRSRPRWTPKSKQS